MNACTIVKDIFSFLLNITIVTKPCLFSVFWSRHIFYFLNCAVSSVYSLSGDSHNGGRISRLELKNTAYAHNELIVSLKLYPTSRTISELEAESSPCSARPVVTCVIKGLLDSFPLMYISADLFGCKLSMADFTQGLFMAVFLSF